VVGYDSIIPPGREGKITPEVSLKNMHGGQLTKVTTVTSNAENTPSLTLSISFVYVPHIDAMPNFIYLPGILNDSVRVMVTLRTEKKDLVVKSIAFKPDSAPKAGEPAPLPKINFTTQRGAAVNEQGQWEYILNLSGLMQGSAMGEFVFTTNHPKKPEIRIKCNVTIGPPQNVPVQSSPPSRH
jgi:hypothetical protein